MSTARKGFNKLVCAACLEDEGLKAFAKQNGIGGICSYCGIKHAAPGVIQLNLVIWEMRKHILSEWNDVLEADLDLPEEGDFEKFSEKCYDAKKLFKQINFSVSNTALMSDFLLAFDNYDWRKNPPRPNPPSVKWADAWEAFKSCVKYERRYTFWQFNDADRTGVRKNYSKPASILFEIKTLLNKSGLVTSVKKGTLIWRFQILPLHASPRVPHRFTPPPIKDAVSPNRMSPAGVPMFYGADDWETAIRELVNPYDESKNGNVATGVQFRTAYQLNVLDLTLIPKTSFFQTEGKRGKHVIEFLREFAEDVSIPINGKQQQIEYVPTQVFTEFVRYLMRGPKGVPIHGIRYSSSRTNRPCWVIFATQAQCLPAINDSIAKHTKAKTRQMLEYVPDSMICSKIPWIKPKSTPP